MAGDEQHGGMLEGLLGKAEDAAGKFISNPEDVDKAKAKAESVLERYLPPDEAQGVVDETARLMEDDLPRRAGQ